MFKIEEITRKNILELKPYSSARQEFSGKANIWLDANENPFETAVNRYPDPYQQELKQEIAEQKGVETSQIFIGNGSDEAIDLLMRAFCEPREDACYIFPPTYGMYEVSANINNVEIVSINLNNQFEMPNLSEISNAIKSKGLLFVCSPNNPTGNCYDLQTVKSIAKIFKGLVVVDEAYIDFSNLPSAISLIKEVDNIVVLQTMSKAYGGAGLRLGMAFANKAIITVLNKIKPPYNVSTLNQSEGLKILKNKKRKFREIALINSEKNNLIKSLLDFECVNKIYPSEANFLLIEFKDSDQVFDVLKSTGIVTRNRTTQIKNCLRVTIGSPEENSRLVNAIKEI